MGVDIRVADWLRQQEHDAAHLRELGMHRAPDDQIFARAVAEDRIVLTARDSSGVSPARPAKSPPANADHLTG